MLDNLIYIAAALIAVLVPVLYFMHENRKSKRAAVYLQKAVERGLDEPISLHPYIDPDICLGTAACVRACPEQTVLGVINNRGALISPAKCIGHGECQKACPVDAITLVFGTGKRGVDIPYLNGDFESNVAGIYIAGELGGMGLIRNAVSQGRQAATNIAKSLHNVQRGHINDLIIVGAGPAGIAASLQARKENLTFITIDQEDLGGTILTYPRRKLVMTQPMELPLYGTVKAREISKENLLELFQDVFKKTGITVQGGEKVNEISREGGHFKVVTNKGEYYTLRVLLAIGRRGSPRKLDVNGEQCGKVAYRLMDPEKFHDLKILVVGGGDSAVEAATALAEQHGNKVWISYRRDNFFRLKEGNQSRIDTAVSAGNIIPLFSSQVTKITTEKVYLEQAGKELVLDNDYVFVFAGGELPSEFLKKIGIEFTRKFGTV